MTNYHIVRDENNEVIGSRKSKNKTYSWAVVGWNNEGHGGVWAYRAAKDGAEKEANRLMNSEMGRRTDLECRVLPVETVTAEVYKTL